MKLKKTIQILTIATLSIGVAAYIVYAIYVSEAANTGTDFKCQTVELDIKENLHAGFITPQSIEKILKDANIYPQGRNMSDISTHKIEEAIKHNDFVEQVTSYKTANQKIHIDIIQRTPVIYILGADGKGYYVDRHGKIIPKTTYPVNMPVATGRISRPYAQKHLARLGNYIVNNEFWNSQVEQISVSTNSDNEYTITLIPRIGHHTINLGTIDNFENKLARLHTFYEKALPTIGWDKYTTINLEYDGQIICKKTKTK